MSRVELSTSRICSHANHYIATWTAITFQHTKLKSEPKRLNTPAIVRRYPIRPTILTNKCTAFRMGK
jgi:hypothetical protein